METILLNWDSHSTMLEEKRKTSLEFLQGTDIYTPKNVNSLYKGTKDSDDHWMNLFLGPKCQMVGTMIQQLYTSLELLYGE